MISFNARWSQTLARLVLMLIIWQPIRVALEWLIAEPILKAAVIITLGLAIGWYMDRICDRFGIFPLKEQP